MRLRAFGTYVTRIKDPVVFIREIAGTDGHFTTDEITDQLRNMIVSRFSSVMADSGIPVLDLAANFETLGRFLTNKILPEFDLYGLELSQMMVESISMPDAVEEALDRRTSMGVVGDLTRYTQYQTAESIAKAAENPGGAAGAGVGIGAGIAMGNQMAGQMGAGDRQSKRPSPGQAGGAASHPAAAFRRQDISCGCRRQGGRPVRRRPDRGDDRRRLAQTRDAGLVAGHG